MLTTYHHPVPLSRNLGTLTSWNPLGLSRPVKGLLYLLPYRKQVVSLLYKIVPFNVAYGNNRLVKRTVTDVARDH